LRHFTNDNCGLSHCPALGTVTPYQAIPDHRVKIQAASCWTSLDSALLTKLAWKAIQKTWHPGTWRHFAASRDAERDARAIRLQSDESENATVSAKKGVCAIQRNGVEIQFGHPNAVQSAPQVDISS